MMPKTIPGCGSDFWSRRTNKYSGCSCPATRYDPTRTKPTDPGCPEHGSETAA